MPKSDPSPKDGARHALAVSGLSQNVPTPVVIEPDAPTRAAIAEELGFEALRKLRFDAEIASEGKRDWRLDGTLGATLEQACVVTLAPVVTRIDVPVTRRYLAHWDAAQEAGSETEMPEDDSAEPLGSTIDPFAVMVEALALAAPDFPRAESAQALGEINVTEPGKQALTDADVKPFAGLAALKQQMKGGADDGQDNGEDGA